MQECLLTDRPEESVPVVLLAESAFSEWSQQQEPSLKRWMQASGFSGKAGSVCLVPNGGGGLRCVLAGIGSADDIWACGGLPGTLPAGSYHLEGTWQVEELERFTLGWGLGAYAFTRYKEASVKTPAKLAVDPRCDTRGIRNQVQSIALVRDLVNTPAQDMMPEHLANAVQMLAKEFNAQFGQIVGDDLLSHNYPVIHAVGRASEHAPRLVDMRWGDDNHPRLTLVGKGVCFDSGGLDLKPANGMRLMKKDMGGAAHAIGLARMIMSATLPVRLRVLVAAVENAVSGSAYRPGDVLRSRQGLTIEIENTDAEGRLVLCDALAEAVTEEPALIVDFATLTGAARVALGPAIPAFFCNAEAVAQGLMAASEQAGEPIWRLPLHKPYRDMLDSKIADIANASSTPFAGAITAALFLQAFVPDRVEWAHFDLMAWNTRARPGRPEGGEAMGLRVVFAYLQERFGS